MMRSERPTQKGVFHVKRTLFHTILGRIHTMQRSTSRPGTAKGST